MQEVLANHTGLMWIDSSARFVTSDLTSIISQAVKHTKGAVLLTRTDHSNFAVTHPNMYNYLPSDITWLQKTEQWETHMLIYRTPEMYHNVIFWLVLCALTEDCIAPPNANRYCQFKGTDQFSSYVGCHRYDQSAVNILMANHFHFEDGGYFPRRW